MYIYAYIIKIRENRKNRIDLHKQLKFSNNDSFLSVKQIIFFWNRKAQLIIIIIIIITV